MRAQLVEESICQKEASLLASGALAVRSGKHTDLAPSSFYRVEAPTRSDSFIGGRVLERERAQDFFRTFETYLAGSRTFETRGYAGPYPVEMQTTSAWHAAFAETMFRTTFLDSLADQTGQIPNAFGTLRVFHDPTLKPSHFELSISEEALVLIDPEAFRIGIIGTAFAGEITNAIYEALHELLPRAGLMPLKAAAVSDNSGQRTCLLLGDAGSGKSTLGLRNSGCLVADQAVIWSDTGISNVFGGCYARLDENLASKTNRFGTLFENASVDTWLRTLDFSHDELQTGGRAAFDLRMVERFYNQDQEARPPETVVFLERDLEAERPLVARVDDWLPELSRLAEPLVGPHLTRALSRRIQESQAEVWILNTGWVEEDRVSVETSVRILETIRAGDFLRFDHQSHPGLSIPVHADQWLKGWSDPAFRGPSRGPGLLIRERF